METAVITGVAGFIGSHLAEKLLKNNFKVIGIDNFTNYYSKKIKKHNLKECLKNKNFSLIIKDLIEIDLLPIFRKSQHLFHLAAQPGVRSSWGSQFETYAKENILVTQRILEYAKAANSLKKIIIASSSSVYGEQKGKMNEENTIAKPTSPYGVTKLTAENLCRIYAENFDLPITTLRYFTVYGPRQRPDMAFMRFIIKSILNQPITIYGNGNQKRNFTYIDDIIDATISSMDIVNSWEIINIGGEVVISINKIISILKKISDFEPILLYKPFPKGDVLRTEADISKAKRLIKFKPKTSLYDGLFSQYRHTKMNMSFYL
jgi:UDP-glucose 4-epimerase